MELSGVLIVNKSEGMTSHDVVNRIRRLYGTRRVGHTGTLDPLATGVLVVLIGRAAKAAEEAAKACAAPEYDMSDPLVVEVLDLIEKRKQAKKDKNFAEADRIREYLESRGVTIKDTREGTEFKIG